MALQSSGAISLADLATEFGGTAPHSMSEYYLNGGLVSSNNTGVPTSGAITLANFYSAFAAIVLDITSNTSDYNILTAATAAGYNAASDTTPIIVNVAAGVTVNGSSTYAMRTGALNADSDLTINVAATASVEGYTGATGGYDSIPGSPGGDAIYWETATGGSGAYSVVNSGTVGGGGGGGGGGGQMGRALTAYSEPKSGIYCGGPILTGSNGSPGAAGGLGQAGAAGTAGAFYPPAVQFTQCYTQYPGAGGAGGAAGFAVRKNGRTVSTTGGGSYLGSAA